MTIEDKATAYHKQGFNCAQSVLCACGEYTGLDEETALAISGGFGGGLRCGEICGAISGAVMAAGLCCRFSDAQDSDTKTKIASLSRYLTGKFREEHGAVRCAEIIKDKSSCDRYIRYMAGLTEQVIKEKL